MKYSLLVLSVLIALNTFSQQRFIKKLWVGDHNEYLLADSNVIRFETFSRSFGNTRIAKYYAVIGDTLKISDQDIHCKPFNSDFLIDISRKNELILQPIDANAASLAKAITSAEPEKRLRFTEIDQFYTDSIRFEKIIFNSTTCYGSCPAMTLEIDNKKQVRFIGKNLAIKQGYFYSTISDSLFYQLLEILKVTELDKIQCNIDRWPDMPTFTLEVHYNNKVKFFQTFRTPFVTDQLVKYLLAIPSKLKLDEARDKFDITFMNN